MIVVGVGVERGADPGALRAAVDALGLPAIDVVATVAGRAEEPAVRALAAGRTLRTYPREALDAVEVPHPSERVRHLAGTGSVAEAAALLAAREHDPDARLVVGKRRGSGVVVAAAATDDAAPWTAPPTGSAS